MQNDLKHCTLSDLVYEDLNSVIRKKIYKMGYTNVRFLDIDGAQAYICKSDTQITFVFRGTEPKEPSDVVADLKAWKEKSRVAGKVHDGFYGELEKLWDKVYLTAMKNRNKDCTITGHSLGAAMATICAARLQSVFNKEIVLYTYGSPRVGNKEFVDILNVEHHRWVNNNDAVTKVPPSWLFYKHHGMLSYLNYYGKVRDGYSFYQRIKDILRGRVRAYRKWQLFRGVYDHSISNYGKKLLNLKGGK